MPLLHETNQSQNNQTDSANQNSTQTNQNQTQSNTGLFSLPPAVMKLVPWIPFILEATTGQKIPQMSGTIGEIQQGIQAIQMNQVQINQRLTALEIKHSETQTKLLEIQTSANQHLSNLTHQFNSLRLTHTKEKKEIAYNNLPEENQNQDY